MSAPSKACQFLLVQVQLGQRLATSPISNSTFNPDFAIAKSALRAATPQLVAADGVNPAEGGLRQNLH
jgi:hypothetical protein